MERSSFFNSVNGDRKYKAEDFASYFGSFISNGIFPNPANNLRVVSNDDMTVTLKPGKGWINGYYYENTDDLILSIDVADGVLDRIDRVVVRLDYVNREIKTVVKKGTFASTPIAPVLQRDMDKYELGLADIKINKGAVSILQSDIIDTRLDLNLCGITNSLITVDVGIITEQFSEDFTAWFETIKGALDGDVAGNLYNLIQQKVGIDLFNEHLADYMYQAPTIAGTQIRISKQSDTNRLYFKLDANLTGGAITISTDNGATSKPLKDIEGNNVVELEKGFVEVVADASFFTLRPRGGKGDVKSVQQGVLNFAEPYNLTKNIPISNVDLSKSIVIIELAAAGASEIGEVHIMAELTSDNNIQISRTKGTSNGLYVTWKVIEFNNVKSIQKFTGTIPTEKLTISPVNLGKSIVFGNRKAFNNTSANTNITNLLRNKYILTDSKTVDVYLAYKVYKTDDVFHIQVVEFN